VNTNVKEILSQDDSLPYIWVRGDKRTLEIDQFFVIIRKSAIPCTDSFCQVLDTCFKSYHLFDMKYPHTLEPVWKFLEFGIFQRSYAGQNVSSPIMFLIGQILPDIIG